MLETIRNRGKRKNGEKGFSLVEILVTVAILAILAAIAIPIFLNQRAKALTASTVSDGRTASQELTTAFQGYTTMGTASGTITQAAGATSLVVGTMTGSSPATPGTITTSAPSPGNSIAGSTKLGAVTTVPQWCIKVTNTNTAAFAVYNEAGYQSGATACAAGVAS